MRTCFLAAALAACAPLAFAQSTSEAGPPAVLQIVRETIKEGRETAHRKVEADYASAVRKAKSPAHYLALSAESGPNDVLFLEAFPTFAAIEENEKLGQKQPLKGELEMINARDGELRAESRSMTAVFRPDMSYLSTSNPIQIAKVRYMMIDNYRVRLGKTEGFTEGGKMLLDGYKKSNMPLSVLCYQVIAGAPNGVYLFITPLESLKQLDGMQAMDKALADAVGADTLKRLSAGEGDVFQNMETTLYAVSPEMSYMSKEEEDVDPSFWRPKVTAVHSAPKETVAKQTTDKP